MKAQLQTQFTKLTSKAPRRLRQLILAGALALFGREQAAAQVSTYSFTQSSGTFTPITGGTMIIDGTSSTSLDSWTSSAITIPAVMVNQVQYTTAWITSNGLLKLGGTAPGTTLYTGNSSAPAGGGVHLSVFNADLNKATSTTASEIRWQTVGNEVVFQWKGWCRYAVTENFDLQVRLNTVTGEIKYVYNLNSGPGTSTSYQPQVGIATSLTDFNNRSVTTTAGQNWNNSIAGTVNTATCRFTSTTDPRSFVSGQTYLWTPPTCWAPLNIANTAVTSGGATITWTAPTPAPANGYEYYINTTNTAPTSSTTATGTASGTSKVLSGLPAATQQYVWMRSVCGADKSIWTASTTFTTLCATPAPGATIATPNTNLCAGATVAFSLTTVPTGPGLSYMWQSSYDGTAYTNITTATSSTLTTVVTDRFYRCRIVCTGGPDTVYSTPVQLNYINSILTATGAQRCGAGTVSLTATASTGATINWYTAAAGGATIGTGSPFTTPSIAVATNFYASAETISAGATTVGSGATTNSSYPNPFYSNWSNTHNQYLITAAELQAAGLSAGNITSLGIKIISGTTALQEVSVKMGHTTATNMSAFVAPTFTNVYTAATLTPVVGINTLTFTTPFNWDGTSNVVIEFCHGNSLSTVTISSNAEADNTSYVSTIHVNKTSATAGNTACADLTSGLTTYSVRPRFYFAGQVVCASPRAAVTATVNTAPAFDVTNNKTVCNNAVTTLTVNSAQASYNNVTWSPVTNLFTDVAATVPYTAGTHAYTVYQKTNTAGLLTYVATANNTATLCGAVDTIKIQTLPAATTAIAATGVLCNSGTSVISLTPAITQTGVVYQWQNSADNTTFTNIATGATGATYTTPSITATQYYRAVIKNSDSATCFNSVSDTVLVNNPQLLSTIPATRCGIGTVTLGATVSSPYIINWYTAATGGTAVATGTSFTTPSINATTTFYAEASTNSTAVAVGPLSPTAQGGTIATQTIAWDINFTVLQATTLTSIDIFPMTSGEAGVLQVRAGTGTGGTLLQTINYTTSVSGGTTAQTIPINFPVAPGAYSLYTSTLPTSGIKRNTSGGVYPYTSAVANITGNGFDNTYYMGAYNWKFGSTCTSARTAVIATVTPAPAFDVTNDKTVCNNAVTALTVNSPAANFNNVTWTPVTNLYTNAAGTTAYTAGTNASTVYFKNATAGLISYTANASNTTTQCANLDTIKIQTLPAAITAIAIPGVICQSGSATVTLTPAITQTGLGYQWQNSTDNTTFTDITTAATSASYTTPTLTATQYYRAAIKNSDGAVCFTSVSDTVKVNNPTIVTTTPAERCGPGPLTLGATTGAGYNIQWYAAQTGGAAIGTGTSFTTPSLNATTTYYAAASAGSAGTATIGNGTYTSVSGTPTFAGTSPYTYHYGNYKHQMLITAAELATAGITAGNITSLAFDVVTAGSPVAAFNNFNISVIPTTTTALTATFLTGGTSVFSAASVTPAVGLNTYTFTTPFNWDGTSNIVIQTCYNNNNSGVVGSSAEVKYDSTAYISHNIYRVDGTQNTVCAATTGNASNDGPITKARPKIVLGYNGLCASNRVAVIATIKPKPTAGLTPNGTINLCAGDNQTLTATGSGNYSWLKNNTVVPGQTGSTLSVNQAGGYKVVVTNTAGCSDTSVAANVTVNVRPIVNLGNDTAVCANVPLTLNAGNPGATYLWNDNSTNSTLVAAAAGQYRVKVTNSFNCAASDTINIAHKVVPVVNLGNDTMICNVQPLTLNATNPGSAYLWNTGATSQTISVNQAGTYSVSVTNTSNCTGNDAIAITVMPQPVNDGFNFEPLFNEAMGKVRFEPINPAANYNYNWNFGDGNTSTADSPVHTYAAAGDYLVSMDVSNGCTDTSVTLLIKVDFTVGTVTVVKNNIDMRLYPNPAQDQLNLELTGDDIYFRNIGVYNVIGQKVIDVKTQKTVTEKISISQLPSGMYILKAETAKGMVMRKFEVIK